MWELTELPEAWIPMPDLRQLCSRQGQREHRDRRVRALCEATETARHWTVMRLRMPFLI